MSGKAIFRNTLLGRNSGRPPFVPFVYGLAARMVGVPLKEMAWNASYYTAGLSGIWELTGNEAVVTNFDGTVERESLGGEVQWTGEYDPPIIIREGERTDITPEEFVGSGRIPVVIDVNRRLLPAVAERGAVACAVTGPCSLALSRRDLLGGAGCTGDPAQALQSIPGLFRKLVRILSESRVDALLFREDHAGELFLGELRSNEGAYKELYATLFNIVRAFNAFPILVTRKLPVRSIAEVYGLINPGGMVFLDDCPGEAEVDALAAAVGPLKCACAISLPVVTGCKEEQWEWVSMAEPILSRHKAGRFFYTSNGEIPYDTAIEDLCELSERLRDPQGAGCG